MEQWVTEQGGAGIAGKRPHGPGPGGAKFLAGWPHPAGLVLVAQPRVAREIIAVVVFQNPPQGGIRQRPGLEDRLVAPEVGIQRTGDGQKRPPRVAVEPQNLAVTERGVVEVSVPSRPVLAQFTIVERTARQR